MLVCVEGVAGVEWRSLWAMDTVFKTISTSRPNYESECEENRAAGVAFKLTGIESRKDREFVLMFAEKYRWTVAHGDGVAFFTPKGCGELRA